MKYLKIFIIIFTFIFGSNLLFAESVFNETKTKISDTFNSLGSGIPKELKDEVASRIDENKEIFAFASVSAKNLGTSASQMKAYDKAKTKITSKAKKEIKNYLTEYVSSFDSYTQSLVKPAFTDLSNHAAELSLNNIKQKGAWEDDKKVYVLLSIAKSDIETHSKNVFNSFLDNMREKIDSVRNK